MTIEERVNVTRGHTGQCVGNSGTVPRLGLPALCFSDAPDGVRGQEFVSAFPAQIHVGATFDRDLLYRYGKALGEEYRGKGINVALLPVAGPLGRVARGGRNWEGFGADPYLSGAGMEAVVKGVQEQGVIAQAKHWLLNEQEYRRNPGIDGEAMSSNVDDRTIHELYAFPFMDAVHAGVASFM
jgi:beta-glucosidase